MVHIILYIYHNSRMIINSCKSYLFKSEFFTLPLLLCCIIIIIIIIIILLSFLKHIPYF